MVRVALPSCRPQARGPDPSLPLSSLCTRRAAGPGAGARSKQGRALSQVVPDSRPVFPVTRHAPCALICEDLSGPVASTYGGQTASDAVGERFPDGSSAEAPSGTVMWAG